jgi:energy-coupling factor transport system substrate-specific component
MTWELASFAVLGLALLAGVLWYERSRPPAKVVALVAALAALATLGRLAFAPLPNVKPTTDIVLLSGFALGGAPGFAVGALTALVSNFVFGQGPWTPWQMAGWGMVGIGGAVLARLVGAHIGRIGLAAACGLAGLGFGILMNVFTWVTFSGDQSLAKLLAIMGTAVPFDAAHVIGNVVFALAFGPLLLRTLLRYRSRLEVSWVDVPADAAAAGARALAGSGARPLALVAVLAAAAVGAAGLLGAPAAVASVATSVGYLERAQNSDGGFGPAPGARSTTLHTGWAALGLAAAGRNPLDVRRGGRSPVDHMRATVGSLRDVGSVERTILVLDASGISPRSFGGRDFVADLRRRQLRNGSFNGQVTLTAFGAMALKAAGGSASAVRRAGAWIAGQQNTNGGFNFAQRGGASGVDDTAAAIQGLVAAGRRRTVAVSRAIAYLRRVQNPDGGFPLLPPGPRPEANRAWSA